MRPLAAASKRCRRGKLKYLLAEAKNKENIPNVYLDHHPEDRTTIDYLKLHETKIKTLKRSYLDDIFGILAGVEAGLGRAVIPLQILKSYKNIQTVRGERKLRHPVYMCYLKQPFYSKLQTAAIKVLKQEVPHFLKI